VDVNVAISPERINCLNSDGFVGSSSIVDEPHYTRIYSIKPFLSSEKLEMTDLLYGAQKISCPKGIRRWFQLPVFAMCVTY